MPTPKLSVCINHKNRSYYKLDDKLVPLFRKSFDVLIESLSELDLPYEVVIADWPDELSAELGLGDWVKTPHVRVIPCTGVFTRGGGRQVAAKQAVGLTLYFMDADMLTPVAVLRRGMEIAAAGKAFFPLYVRQSPSDPNTVSKGIGTGNAIIARTLHEKSSGYPSTKGWGGEDTEYAHWFKTRGLMVREHVAGYTHQWHPGDHNA